MDQDPALRLRRVRLERGLSQRQLGRRSGVANATISQIEAGKLNPTVSMLKKVLDGIPMTLSEFFSDSAERSQQLFYRASELTEIAEGGISYRQVGANLNERRIQFLHEAYQPQAGTGRHMLSHKGEECGLVLKGHLQVTVGDETTVLRKGDAYYFHSDQRHSFHNPGSEVCELVSACTPPSF